MEIKDMNMEEIEARMAEINGELDNPDADIDALEVEVRSLKERKEEIKVKAEKRAALLKDVNEKGVVIKTFDTGEKKVERTFDVNCAEYRSAWLNNLRNIDLNEVEKRALTTVVASAGAVVPTVTVNKIVEKVHQYAPLLEKIELLHVKGNVTIPAEGTTLDAAVHTQGAVITASADTFNNVTLSAYEITKLITISKSVMTMSIDAFESWLVNKLARKIADKITELILNGTGNSQPQGINAITWNATNSVTVGAAASLTEANILTVVGLLNGGYDTGAEWLMSKKTFMADFYPLMNKSKNVTIDRVGDVWYVQGYPVTMDERVADHEAVLGNLYRGYIGNMEEEVNVTSQFVTRENAFDFLGCSMFDGKVQAIEAFVKIKKEKASA